MNADQAFDNLMNKKALAIPVAKRGRDSTHIDHQQKGEEGRGETMRVSDLLDDRPGDYHPREAESIRAGYSRDTETDMDPVKDIDSVTNAHMHGARIVGRDTREIDTVDDLGAGPPAGFTESEEVREPGEFGLGLARRVPRFAFLPLGGMDAFEAGAREMMASLSSMHADRPSLAITSPERREGRTELAIRLALAVSRKVGSKVLLIDFDIRMPGVAVRLGLSTKYFTAMDVLRGSCRLGEALVWSEEDDLYVLPGRITDREGDEILDSRQVEALLDEVHQAFDFAIIDCGPAGQADAMVICRLAGATAIAGRSGRSSATLMRLAAENLSATGAKVAGMLITG